MYAVYSLYQSNNTDGTLGEIHSYSSSSSNYVANTDGTVTDLSVEWMVEDLNTGLQCQLENLQPTHSLVQCLTTGVHILLH